MSDHQQVVIQVGDAWDQRRVSLLLRSLLDFLRSPEKNDLRVNIPLDQILINIKIIIYDLTLCSSVGNAGSII